jgi:uroporphyrinogen-III synthase
MDAERQNVSQLLEMLRNGKIDVVTFASPSAANNFFRAIPPEAVSRSPRPPRIAVIGPATAQAVVGLGMDVDIAAKESTVAGLVSAIAEFYES